VTTRHTPLQTLLHALEKPGSCFILGAGASAPIVPLASELGLHIRKRLLSIGSFPATPIVRDEISERILTSTYAKNDRSYEYIDTEEELVARHLSPGAIYAAAMHFLRPQAPLITPPQYLVFSLSQHRIPLINFNNDGLANQYCSNHHIINVHGTSLSANQRAALNWDSYINQMQDFPGIKPPAITGLLLPQKEPLEIAKTPNYHAAKAALQVANRIIIVGYSFGEMDDGVTYTMITSAIRARCIHTVIVKPSAVDLAARMIEDSGTKSIAPLSVYWDKLSSAIITSIAHPQRKACDHARLCQRCVAYLYEAFLDGRSAGRMELRSY
jgi:hypothetical protein